MLGFAQQHAVVTGGSSGIGQATAVQLAESGSHVSIISRNRDKLESARRRIMAARASDSQRVVAIAADVTDAEAVALAVQRCAAECGPPSLLVASAGMVQPGLFRDLPLTSFTRTMDLNYAGTVHAIKAVLPFMEQQRRGRIVMVSSGAGLLGVYGYSSYSPSKFALHGLAQVLACECKPHGIGVSIVYPPDTDTPQLIEENKTKPEATKLITGSARVLQPEDVARSILRGIKRKRFAITPGVEMTLLSRLQSLLVPVIRWQMDKTVSKCIAIAEKSMGEPG